MEVVIYTYFGYSEAFFFSFFLISCFVKDRIGGQEARSKYSIYDITIN